MNVHRRHTWLIVFFGLMWFGATSVGFMALLAYSTAKGTEGITPGSWITESSIPLDHSHPTLIMFVHPKCPCSRASIGELNALLAAESRVNVYVLFIRPPDAAEDWTQTDLWKAASAIPSVNVQVDERGIEARRFHAVTSGHCVLYTNDGKLIFSGGITSSRGHSGDNVGRSTIVSLLQDGTSPVHHTPTYGCTLVDPHLSDSTGAILCKQ